MRGVGVRCETKCPRSRDALIGTALLDLDGTIADTRPGIVASIRHAVRCLGHEPNPDEDLSWAIGPPVDDVMGRILGAHEDNRIGEAIRLYRDRYGATGLFEATLYPGVDDMLHGLAQAGVDLILATSKRRSFAERVLVHFGLVGHFRSIYGSEPSGALDEKSDLLAHLLAAERLNHRNVVMIGDRIHDIAAAQANGMRAIGVLWGYGSRQELVAANADSLAAHPSDVSRLIAALI